MYKEDKIFTVGIMDTVAGLPFLETTLKIKETIYNFPVCVNINKQWVNSISQDRRLYTILIFFSITGIIPLQIYYWKLIKI